MAAGLGGCLAVVSRGCRVLGCGVAAGWGLGEAAGAGFAGVRRHPALPLAGPRAAVDLAVGGAPAVGTGLGARVDGVARGLGGDVLDEGVVVEVDEVVVVVEVVEWEAEETDVGDGGWSRPESEVEETHVGDRGGPGRRGRALAAGSCRQ